MGWALASGGGLHVAPSRKAQDGSWVAGVQTYQEQTSVATSVVTTQRAAEEPRGSPKNLQKGQGSYALASSLKASQGDPMERSS